MTVERVYQDVFSNNDKLWVRADLEEVEFEAVGSARYVFLDFDEVEGLRDFLTEWLSGQLGITESSRGGCD